MTWDGSVDLKDHALHTPIITFALQDVSGSGGVQRSRNIAIEQIATFLFLKNEGVPVKFNKAIVTYRS